MRRFYAKVPGDLGEPGAALCSRGSLRAGEVFAGII